MKKFRGKKRYFRNLWRKVDTFQLNLEDESWFDFWHIHLDFFGVGNASFRIRREHIKANLALYNKLLRQLETYKKPYQTWITIHVEDTGSDAVYIHTSNPNNDYFPQKFDELNWNCSIPSSFKDLIDLNLFNVGYYKSELEEVYFVQSNEHGITL